MGTNTESLIGKTASSFWWLVLLKGITTILLGLLLFINPGVSLIVVMMFLGGYWFVDGIFTLVSSIQGKKENKDWGWGVFVSILSILAGISVFSQPLASSLFTTTFLAYFMGFLIITSGISSIVTGFKLHKTSGEWVMIINGVLALLLGVLLLFNPIFTVTFFVSMLGLFSIIGGVSLIILSFLIRKLKYV